MSITAERRKRHIAVLRELYVKAQADLAQVRERKEKLKSITHDQAGVDAVADASDIEFFREGVLEGIRRVAYAFLGCLDVECVTEGKPMCDEDV